MQQRTSKAASQQQARTISHGARSRGIACIGAPGVGKSRLFGRVLAWPDFLAEIPQLIIDPIGGTIDNFLSKIVSTLTYLPKDEHHKVWERLIYVDMHATTGYISPFPLYYTLGNESLWDISERYLQVTLKSDPALLTAPRSGWNALRKIGTFTGMALFSLNEQITTAEEFLRNPSRYLSRLTRAQTRYPELAAVIAYFRDEYCKLRPYEREELTTSFKAKIFPFTLSATHRALFGAKEPAIKWPEVAAKRQTVLLDFRHVTGELRRFLLLWVFDYLYAYIKTRGRYPQPFGLIIDEFVALTQKVVGENPLGQELDEFIQQYMRQHLIWLSVGLQSPLSLDEHLQQTVLSLGSLIIGQAPTKAAAAVLAANLCFPNPHYIKHERVIQRNPYSYRGVLTVPEPQKEPVFMPINEQLELYMQRIQRLGMYSFLLRPAVSEGEISTEVYPIHIRDVDRDRETGAYQYPDKLLMERLRAKLVAKSGIPVTDILKEQETRLTKGTLQTPRKPQPTAASDAGERQPSLLPGGTHPEPRSVRETPSRPTLAEDHVKLLRFLMEHPDAPVSGVYKKVGIRAAAITPIRRELTAHGLLSELEVRTGSTTGGRPVKFLLPTIKAWELVGIDPPKGRGGAIHKQVQRMVVHGALAKGYSAIVEHTLSTGGIVDVHLQKGAGVRIAVEIGIASRLELEIAHFRNCLAFGYDQVYGIIADDQLLQRTATLIRETFSPLDAGKVRLLPLSRLSAVG
jgi:hypothetical protein